MARQIVREIHGDIWAESAGEGKGSTFFVQLSVEGSKHALRAGTKLTVGIKAAEAGEKAEDAPTGSHPKLGAATGGSKQEQR